MIDLVPGIPVADAVEGHTLRVDPEVSQERKRPGHKTLTTGLVDETLAGFDHHHRQPGQPRLDRRRQPYRAAPGHDDVGIVGHPSSRSARSSVGMRNPSNNTALSAVKAIAVIQAVCTSGSAIPSMATTT